MLFNRRKLLAAIPPAIVAGRATAHAQSAGSQTQPPQPMQGAVTAPTNTSTDAGATARPTGTATTATAPANTVAAQAPTAPAAPVAPVVTGPAVDFALPTTAGRDRNVSAYRGKVVILFYETRGAITMNQHVKDAMGRQFNADRSLANRFALIAACNVAEYNSWPSQYFAREAISAVARSQHIELWLDWQRSLISRLALRDGTSNIVLIDKQGRVRSRRFGRVADGQVQAFINEMLALGNE